MYWVVTEMLLNLSEHKPSWTYVASFSKSYSIKLENTIKTLQNRNTFCVSGPFERKQPLRTSGFPPSTAAQLASDREYWCYHYSDVIMGAMASQITSLSSICSTVCSGADQRKHQISASMAFVRGIHQWPVNSPHNGPVTRKFVQFDDVMMIFTVRLTNLSNQ